MRNRWVRYYGYVSFGLGIATFSRLHELTGTSTVIQLLGFMGASALLVIGSVMLVVTDK